MLGQTGRLSERQRVKPRLSLSLIRIRYFVVSLIPWSEVQSHPPSPQNFLEMGLFSELFKTEVNEYIAFKSKARPEGFLILIVLKPRHFYVFSLFSH